MRCVVFAYHDIGVACLRELLAQGAEVVAVFTHDDDPGENIWFHSVRGVAEEKHLPVFAPDDVNRPEWVQRLRAWQPDFLFSFYYRRLLSPEILAIPARGAFNLHGSLLPRYRGRCPVNWVLIHGETQTGVTLHHMVEKPDRGDIVSQRAVPISDDDTAATLYAKLTVAAAQLMRDVYPRLCDGTAARIPQDHSRASYFGGRRPEDGRIDWQQPARSIFNLVRAVTHPYPGAFATWNGARLYVWAAGVEAGRSGAPGRILSVSPELIVGTGSGGLVVRRVQGDGEAEMSGAQWAAAHSVREGESLG